MIKVKFFNDYNSKLSYNSKLLKNIANEIMYDNNNKSADISIIFSDRKKLNELKKDFFKLDHYTDVIAFNLQECGEPIEGEIYISIDDVISNAKNFNQSLNEEFKRIFIHGLLHLVGYNDITDDEKQIMNNLENEYLSSHKKEVIDYA